MAESMYVTPRTAADYEQQFPTRLSINDLNEGGITNLMLRCNGGVGPEAYLGPVLVERFKRRVGSVGLTVCFLNDDMKPVGYKVPSEVRHDIWFPKNPYPLVSPDKSTNTQTKQGYFLPYEEQSTDDVLAEMEQLFHDMRAPQPKPIFIDRLVQGSKRTN